MSCTTGAADEIADWRGRQIKRAPGGALVLITRTLTMSSSKNPALIILALATIGGAVLAWKQQMELQGLRAAALGGADREELKRRALAAEKRAQALEDALAAAQGKLNEATATAGAKPDPARQPEAANPAANMRAMMSNAANMMNRPEMQRMMAMGAKAGLDARYAPLFKQLNLAPDKLEELKKLMVERQSVGADVFAAAAQQGLDPMQNRRELAKLTTDGQAKVDGEIQSLLGDTSYSAYQNYQSTLPQRSVVNQLQQSLSYTPNPLSDTQTEQLVQILAQNQPPHPAGASGQNVTATRTMVVTGSVGGPSGVVSTMDSGPMMVGSAPISDAAVAASRTILNDPQVAALQQLQQQQNQMGAIMQSMGGQPGHGGAAVIQFNAATTEGPPPPPPAGDKPPGGG